MRNLLILAALAAMVLTAGEARAGRRSPTYNGNVVRRGDGPFSRLMELERRKNAALRDMFRR